MKSRQPAGAIVRSIAFLAFEVLLVGTVVAQQPVNSPAPGSTTAGAITGRVLNESGEPIAGANVFVRSLGSIPFSPISSDSEGNFKAEGLDAGIYRVSAAAPGYAMDAFAADLETPPRFYRPGDSVTVTLTKGGVITGTITDADGRPVINTPVRAFQVSDVQGKPVTNAGQTRERFTDDRGSYRLYGLRSGAYIVSVGGRGQIMGFSYLNQYERDAPTYAPSSTRDTAAEIMVRAGQEALVDIRYRGEPGHSISGKVSGAEVGPDIQSAVRLVDVQSRIAIATASAISPGRAFELMGVSDGEYEISAIAAAGPGGQFLASQSQRVTVKGTDIVGMELVVAPLGSITGRVIIEGDPQLNCGRRRDTALREAVITTRRDPIPDRHGAKTSRDKPLEIGPSFLPTFVEAAPNDKGEITARNLPPGVYRLETRLPGSDWYLKSIAKGPPDQRPSAVRSPENIARDGLTLKSGDKLSGVTITITEGGASLRGQISPAEGQRLPPGLRVYVVPAERESADNVLRFFETSADSDGAFAVGNIAPGKYWIVARLADESDSGTGGSIRKDSAVRSKVLREAEASKKEIQFKPCERTTDYALPYAPAPTPRP